MKLVENDSQVNDDWTLIIVINQACQSFNPASPRLQRGTDTGEGGGSGGGGGHWDSVHVSSIPPAGSQGMVRRTNTYSMSCHESICCAAEERP